MPLTACDPRLRVGLDLATRGSPYPLAAPFNEIQPFSRLDNEPAEWISWRVLRNKSPRSDRGELITPCPGGQNQLGPCTTTGAQTSPLASQKGYRKVSWEEWWEKLWENLRIGVGTGRNCRPRTSRFFSRKGNFANASTMRRTQGSSPGFSAFRVR